MTKFLAVVKREYIQRVRSKLFILMTFLGPLLLVVFTVVPTLLMGIKTEDTRIAIIDQTEGGKLLPAIQSSLTKSNRNREQGNKTEIAEAVTSNTSERVSNAGKRFTGGFVVTGMDSRGRSLPELQQELNARVGREELEGYLIIPSNIIQNSDAKPVYFSRNTSDIPTQAQIERALNDAVRKQRLTAAGVSEEALERLSKPVDLEVYSVTGKGEAGGRGSGMLGFAVPFITAFLIYITVLLYGQVVLGAVVEEKETRIAEILFSSVRSWTLMLGKLIGVSLVAVTQLGIWVIAFGALTTVAAGAMQSRGFDEISIPLPKTFVLYLFIFFVLGYFLYATLYLLIGSMVTTTQEGGQVAMPIIFMLMAGLYMAFPVMRSPNSSFATGISLVPFFSPIVMLVRIVTQTPPFWQIALSVLISILTILLLLWIAARAYRVGMLMYGKKATIPELLRWIRQT